MKSIVFREAISRREFRELQAEFPHYRYLWLDEESPLEDLEDEQWAWVEIVYGRNFSARELAKCHQLRWVHSPVPDFDQICLDDLEKQGNVIVTNTKEHDAVQMSEFVLSATLSFAKNLFQWKSMPREPQALWHSPLSKDMWLLRDRICLQVGLGNVGSEIASMFQKLGVRVWGVRNHRSFHPSCDKIIAFQDLHSVLPMADIISVALPRGKRLPEKLGEAEFALMKKDAILIVTGSGGAIDEDALAEAASKGKFRGVVLDVFSQTPLSKNSPLWNVPNLFITPTIASYPETVENLGFSIFRYNLRQFLHGNFKEMKNLIEISSVLNL